MDDFFIEIKILAAQMHLMNHINKHWKPGVVPQDWYVGISGMKDKDRDGKSDRFLGHKQVFPNLDEGTWEQYRLNGDNSTNAYVGKEVERRMRTCGCDVGTKIKKGSLPIKIVYTFRKETEINLDY